jgi:hypothetical protein
MTPPTKPIPTKPPRVSIEVKDDTKKGFFAFAKKGFFPFGKKKLLIAAPESEPIPPKPKTDILKPFKEELTYEWKWLLKKLRIYDYDEEEKNLVAYRKLRGWN